LRCALQQFRVAVHSLQRSKSHVAPQHHELVIGVPPLFANFHALFALFASIPPQSAAKLAKSTGAILPSQIGASPMALLESQISTPTSDLQAQIDALRAQNDALRAKLAKPNVLRFKVSEKGAVSVYGINTKFPLTLYREQMVRLLDAKDDILAFIEANSAALKTKTSA
jgi:hypothetical protein